MADPRIRAAFYLSPTVDALWRWSDDGQVLTWPDNSTIAFRAEVEAVLDRLAPGGMPPFGAVALLLAACREGWMQSMGREVIVGYSQQRSVATDDSRQVVRLVAGRISRLIAELVEGLDRIHALPPEDAAAMRTRKELLAEAVFEGFPSRGSREEAALIIEGLESGITGEMLRPQLSHEDRLSQFARQTDGLSEGLARINIDALVRRRKTGLDEEVITPCEDISPPDAVRQLLAEMSGDTELAGLAKLAHDLMAAVAVPRTLHAHEQLAVGGVSDLTNRGPLDRLLVSELAHDDLTLAVRVAVNEALYLRRETPPAEPPHRRAILLDSGVRMWGLPRLFATAAALAFAATNDPAAELEIHRAAGAGVEPVDLTTRAGLHAHLGALESAAHPGAALPAFFAAIEGTGDASRSTGVPPVSSRGKQSAVGSALADASSHSVVLENASAKENPTAKGGKHRRDARATENKKAAVSHTDAVLITHADVLNDPEFIAALASADVPPMYVAAVDRTGGFKLLVLSQAGRKPVREAEFALDDILRPSPTRSAGQPIALVNKAVDPSLPAILFLDSFPLYLPHVVDPARAAVSTTHGMVGVTHDGRLLHWTGHNVGARQLSSLLPGGHLQCVFIDEIAERVGVLITRKRKSTMILATADLRSGACTLCEWAGCDRFAAGAFVWRGLVYVAYADRVDAFSISDGSRAGSVKMTAGMRWNRDRFFRTSDAHFTIAYDGTDKLRFERLPINAGDVITPIDVEGSDGPWAVARQAVYDSSGKKVQEFPQHSIARIIAVSRDGGRIAFESKAKSFMILMKDHSIASCSNRAEEVLSPQIHWSTQASVHPRNRFKTIFVDAESRLVLRTPAGNNFMLDLDNAGALILMEYGRDAPFVPVGKMNVSAALFQQLKGRLAQDFSDMHRLPGTLLKMRVAKWADGSRAYLDSRGILHLKSSDRAVPEVSITLSNIQPAAWSSEGKVTGSLYFIGDSGAYTPRHPMRVGGGYFLDLIGQFIARLR